MYNFEEICRKVLENPAFSIKEFYTYDDEWKDELLNQANHYQSYFDKKLIQDYQLGDVLFFINSDEGNSAYAEFSGAYPIISIGALLYKNLAWEFDNNKVFINQMNDFVHGGLFVSPSPNVDSLMFQAVINFLFFHELGHIIQFKDGNLARRKEATNEKIEDFDIIDHLEEIDADTFACMMAVEQIMHYYSELSKGFKEYQTKETIEKILLIHIVSISQMFILFMIDDGDFYLKQHTHPHPSIRIMNLVSRLIEFLNHNLKKRGDFHFDEDKESQIYQTSLGLIDTLSKEIFGANHMYNVLKLAGDFENPIKEYYGELIELLEEQEYLAVNKRNALIESKQQDE